MKKERLIKQSSLLMVFSALLTVICLILSLPLVSAAEDTSKVEGVEVLIQTDKNSYTAEETVHATVTITNGNYYAIENLQLQIFVPDGLILADESLATKTLRLEPGETLKLEGIDFTWKNPNEVNQELCEYNAKAEKVEKRVSFAKDTLAKLSFEDETFDAVVSNMAFHKASGNKQDMVREAIRVLKPGGAFCIEDNFRSRRLFGNMEKFCEDLLAEGVVSEIHYAPNNDKLDFIPSYLRFPWTLGNMGMIWGKK
jgi:SAM-dependent methyltransferase